MVSSPPQRVVKSSLRYPGAKAKVWRQILSEFPSANSIRDTMNRSSAVVGRSSSLSEAAWLTNNTHTNRLIV
jgi:hypothetical protein